MIWYFGFMITRNTSNKLTNLDQPNLPIVWLLIIFKALIEAAISECTRMFIDFSSRFKSEYMYIQVICVHMIVN